MVSKASISSSQLLIPNRFAVVVELECLQPEQKWGQLNSRWTSKSEDSPEPRLDIGVLEGDVQ